MRHLRWWTGSERVDMGLGSPKVGLNEPFDWAQCRWVEALRQAQGERWEVLRSVATSQTVRAEPVEAPPQTPLERVQFFRAVTS